MIISEVNSLVDLVLKATSFANQLEDSWYKGSAEVDSFRDQVLMLARKHSQWSAQLRRHGLSEDACLLQAVQAAVQVLDKQEKYVKRLQNNPFLRLRRKAFPGRLAYSLNMILEIVDAGPQLLAGRVSTYDLMERSRAQTPAKLPFIADSNYVPISESILDIRAALEDEESPRVVTLFGGPGLGKSSVVKYLALHYQEEKSHSLRTTQPETISFPDGVFYLFCGKGAQERAKQLQLELLESLGFGPGSAAPPDDSTGTGVLEEGYLQLPSHHMKLSSRLAQQKVLIILDDVWEWEVLQQLLVPAKGVKYVITSQMREIWGPAARIQMRSPTLEEARQIMSNYTKGLPMNGKFPKSIQSVTDTIITKLDYHPLSLADIGSSINSSRATDSSHWKAISDDIHGVLDYNDKIQCSRVVYDQPYNLSVKASMMLMVECLHPEAQRLLFLISLLLGHKQLPETLVRYFYKVIQSHQNSDFLQKYNNHEKYLEDRSLVELHTNGQGSSLSAHGLRMAYIRENRTRDVRLIASHILASSDRVGAEVIQTGDAEPTLVTILSAIYFTEPFKDIAVNTLQNHLRILNDGVISRTINSGMNPLDFVDRVRGIENLLWLLNVDDGDFDWKQQAHEYAKKIIIKLASQGEVDDFNMARLLQLHQATSRACEALEDIYLRPSDMIIQPDLDENNKTFLSTHGETMDTLLILLQDDALSTYTRVAVARALIRVLCFPSNDTIATAASKFMERLAMDSNPILQTGLPHSFLCADWASEWARRSVITCDEFTAILEVLMGLLLFGNVSDVRVSAGRTLSWFCKWKCTALKIAVIPDALDNLFYLFLSKDSLPKTSFFFSPSYYAGYILGGLSCVEENRVKFRALKSGLDRLANFLAGMEGTWLSILGEEERAELEERAFIAAGILGELGLEKELRDYICSFPGVKGGLLFFQTIEKARLLGRHWIYPSNTTKALATLYANNSNPKLRDVLGDVPSRSEQSEEVFSSDKNPSAEPSAPADLHCRVLWNRVVAHMEMGDYKAALEDLEVTQYHLDQNVNRDDHDWDRRDVQTSTMWWYQSPGSASSAMEVLSSTRIYLQAMLEDHAGALLGANKRVEEAKRFPYAYIRELANRGIVKRLARDLQGALDDLNAAYQQKAGWWDRLRYDVLKHRGYVKHLMEDDVGAKEDAEAALELKKSSLPVVEDSTIGCKSFWDFEKVPINYLGYFL